MCRSSVNSQLEVAELFLALLYALTVRSFQPGVHVKAAKTIHHIRADRKASLLNNTSIQW